MNILKKFFRNEEQQSVDVIQMWEVRWYSHHRSSYSSYANPSEELRAFPTEADAAAFVLALEDANRLLGNRSNLIQSSIRKGGV